MRGLECIILSNGFKIIIFLRQIKFPVVFIMHLTLPIYRKRIKVYRTNCLFHFVVLYQTFNNHIVCCIINRILNYFALICESSAHYVKLMVMGSWYQFKHKHTCCGFPMNLVSRYIQICTRFNYLLTKLRYEFILSWHI